jgi:Ser/Thr protein kinase RdoA (MazF antagonist)
MIDLIALYKQRLNLQGATFLLIEHEDAMVAIVYKVTLPSGDHLILKICSSIEDYLREVYFLNYFANKLPIPKIMRVVEPETGVKGAILMEYLPGTLLQITEFSDAMAFEVGVLLARIHLNRVKGYGDLTQTSSLSSDPRLNFTLKFEEGLSECSNHLPKELISQCRNYYDANCKLLLSVDGPCIIHRDFRPGNIIVSDGNIQGIIDWASGRASFAEEDFCPIELGEWSTKPSMKKSFLLGYASIRPVPDYSAVMPLLRMSRAVATIGFTVKRGTWDGSNARVYKLSRSFLESFFNRA